MFITEEFKSMNKQKHPKFHSLRHSQSEAVNVPSSKSVAVIAILRRSAHNSIS